VRHGRGGRPANAAHQGVREAARGGLLPQPRPRCRARDPRGADPGDPRPARARRGRRRHARAGDLPAGLRRLPARGSRPRHRGRRREPDPLPVRPEAVGGLPMDATETSGHAIETIFLEERRYPPTAEFAAQANAQPELYERDWLDFWADEAGRRVTWFEPFTET